MKRMVQLPMLRPQTTTAAAAAAAAATASAAVRGSRQFGVPLSELCALGLVAEEDGVPLVVRRMVEHLRQHALQQEGLFRVNGNVRAVETLKKRLQSGEEVDLLAEAEVCTVASLLKQYLRDLPEGLVHAAVQAALIQQYQECGEDGSWGDLRAVLRRLPDVHHRLLSYFCHFLTEVASHHQHNRMTALNLATVFGPSVFHVSPGFEAMKEQNICNKIMAKLIQNYSNIFDSSRDGDKDGCTGELPTLIIVKEAHLMNVDSESSPTTSSPRSQKSPVHAKKKVKKAMGDEVSPATPQPRFSAGTPHVRRLAPQPSSAILEQMAPPPRPPSPPANTSPSSSVELHDCFPEEERAISPFYMSNHLFPIHCRPDVTNFLDRTIRAAVQQHLFEINPLDCPGVQGPGLRGPSLLGPGLQGPGLQGPRELAPCSGPPLLTTSARQRRRQQREQKEEEGEREPERSRSTSSLRADLHKENIPWDKQNLLNTLSEGNLAVGVAPQQTQRVQNHHQPRTPKPWKPRPGPALAQHDENLETPTVQVQECSMTGTASRSEGATMDAPTAARRRKESWNENGLPPPQRPRMKIQESLGVCGVGERSPRGLADTDCGEARDDVPRLELAEEDDGNWGEPVPAYSSWQRDSMDREEARLSPHASGHLIRQLMEEGNDPMLSPRFYGYGHCQQYLDDTEVPPSPPNAHSFSSRRRSCSLGSCDEEKEELSSAQLSKRIHVLKKKIHRFEEKFEYERKYRPSHSDKLANPEVLRWVNELTRLRKNLKEHKLLKSEEDLPPQTRQRSNTLPKSFGSQLDKKSQQEKTPLPPAESTLEVVLSKLREKREEVGRPEDIKDMSREQIGAEKLALQKALLYYESIHGRPVTKSERQTMKPLYDRYRLVKQILCRASSIPVIGSPSSKRRGPLLQPIIEGVPALFFDDIKEEEDGSEDDGDSSRPQVPASDRPNLSMLGFLDQLEEEAADGFISPLDDPSPSRSTTHDMRLSNLHSATMQELVEQLQETREEKKRIRMNLREYEDQFFRENGRNLQKEERSPLALEYNEYKHVKAKLRLLEVLISKRDSTKFI